MGFNEKLWADIKNILTTLTTKANKTQEVWIEPTMINGWVDANVGFYGKTRYRKNQFGNIEFAGAFSSGTTNQTVFTLPVGYRPTENVILVGASGGTSIGKINIAPTGEVSVSTIAGTLYLNSISFFI